MTKEQGAVNCIAPDPEPFTARSIRRPQIIPDFCCALLCLWRSDSRNRQLVESEVLWINNVLRDRNLLRLAASDMHNILTPNISNGFWCSAMCVSILDMACPRVVIASYIGLRRSPSPVITYNLGTIRSMPVQALADSPAIDWRSVRGMSMMFRNTP